MSENQPSANENAKKGITLEPDEAAVSVANLSDKNFVLTLLLCSFLGSFGVHRFYVGKVGTGILMLLTLGAFGIWMFVDFIMIIIGRFRDKAGLPVKIPPKIFNVFNEALQESKEKQKEVMTEFKEGWEETKTEFNKLKTEIKKEDW